MNASECVEQLRQLKLDHENFRLTYNRAYSQCALAPPGQVIAVVGPTRVGKTTLSRRLGSTLIKDPDLVSDKEIHLARIEAATTNQGKFSTKHFTLRALQELGDPMIQQARFRKNQSETHLRLQLERCIQYRRTRYLIIDEAHHLLRTQSTRYAGEILDTFKCLGNSTGLILILFGGYELLKACFSSAHLNGRLTVIDFPPYALTAEPGSEFDRILLTLSAMLPFTDREELLANRDFIYAGSLGCLGLLVGWCISALAEMNATEENTLELHHFEQTRCIEQIRPIAEEIELGRQIMPSWAQRLQSKPSQVSRRAKSAPFVRKPRRDPTPIDSCEKST